MRPHLIHLCFPAYPCNRTTRTYRTVHITMMLAKVTMTSDGAWGGDTSDVDALSDSAPANNSYISSCLRSPSMLSSIPLLKVVSDWFGLLNLNRMLPDSQERRMILEKCNMARSVLFLNKS